MKPKRPRFLKRIIARTEARVAERCKLVRGVARVRPSAFATSDAPYVPQRRYNLREIIRDEKAE